MTETLDKPRVRQDLLKWAERLKKIDTELHALHAEMNEIYKEAL